MTTNNLSLSFEQNVAFQKYMEKKNLFITGPGGTGKSKLIHTIIHHANNLGKKVQVCAMSGCAAVLLNCNARTVHSWFGLRLARGTHEDILKSIYFNKKVCSDIRKTDLLIIDEVSMMSQKIFEVVVHALKSVRRNYSHPTGGLQLIFTGDFFQLPPVGSDAEPKTMNMCFESEEWYKTFSLENHIQLHTMFRQTDPTYIKVLMEIRKGTISQESIDILTQQLDKKYDETTDIIPTKLFAVNAKANHVNSMMYGKLKDPEFEYHFSCETNCTTYLETGAPIPAQLLRASEDLTNVEKERELEFIVSNIPCDKTIRLKKGAFVMCVNNLNLDRGICNGSQGVIVGFVKQGEINQYYPRVKFHNGVEMTITPSYWQSESFPSLAIGQIPLKLAWALTIHKIQGATLDTAEMDIGGSVFEYGQMYVALSRVKNLDGLYLIDFQPSKIKANPKVIDFYNQLPTITAETYIPPVLTEPKESSNELNFDEFAADTESNPNIKTITTSATSAFKKVNIIRTVKKV